MSIGHGETVVVWRVIEDEEGALIVLHVWPGGRELVVASW